MRITENMITLTYGRNLQRNISDLVPSSLKLSSRCQYGHVSEDPATASKAFVIRDQIVRSEERISAVKSARGELDTADSNIVTLNSMFETVHEKTIKTGGANSQGSMDAIAEELGGLKEEILRIMNARCGGKSLFFGSSNSEAPFTVDGDGNLLFDGKPVDAYDKNDPNTYSDENGPVYLDIGLGTHASGANTAKTGIKIPTSGMDMLGHGKDGNGLPNDLYSLMGKAEEQLRGGGKEGVMDTLSQFERKQSNISIATSGLETRERPLDHTENCLEMGLIDLQKGQADLEPIKIETEATNNKSYETAWMIALQLGSSIVPPSIFDFMK